MKIARYWERATAELEGSDGTKGEVAASGWSDRDREEARRAAEEAARRIAERIQQGGRPSRSYGYGERPLKEEIVRELHDGRGERIAAVTRNSYGALVLNTAHAAFVDVDVPVPAPFFNLRRRVRSLLGWSTKHPAQATWDRLIGWVEQNPDRAVRIYETHSGYRVLVTDRPLDPTGEEARSLLQELHADGLYRRLCERQECFRARLTPKPWRCGMERKPPHRYPFLDDKQEREQREWEERYERAWEGYATCRLLQHIGPERMPEEIEPVVKVHDELTRCESDLPLA